MAGDSPSHCPHRAEGRRWRKDLGGQGPSHFRTALMPCPRASRNTGIHGVEENVFIGQAIRVGTVWEVLLEATGLEVICPDATFLQDGCTEHPHDLGGAKR